VSGGLDISSNVKVTLTAVDNPGDPLGRKLTVVLLADLGQIGRLLAEQVLVQSVAFAADAVANGAILGEDALSRGGARILLCERSMGQEHKRGRNH